MNKRVCVLVAAVCAMPGVAAAQLTPDWQATIQPSGPATVFDTATGSDGSTFVASTVDFSAMNLTRLNADGTVAWTKVFDVSVQDQAEAVALSFDESSVYLLGSSSQPLTSSDYVVIKYDAITGNEIWVRFLDGGDEGIDSPSDIAATTDGGCVVTGGFDTPNEQRDFGTARLDADGNELWRRYYSGFGQFLFENDDAEYVAVDSNGDVLITGNAMSGSDSDIVTIKYNGVTGATVWEAMYEGFNNDAAEGLGFLPSGDVVVLGLDSLTSGSRLVLACYDGQTGAEKWSLLYGRGVEQRARHLAIGDDGTVYAAGLFDPTTSISGDSQLTAIAVNGQTGALLWETSFGDPGTNNGESGDRIYPDNNGSVWVVGSTSSDSIVGSPLEEDGLLLQLEQSSGAVQSVTLLDTSTSTETFRDSLRHAGMDSQGRLYVVGRAEGGSSLPLIAARYTLNSCVADVNGDGQLTPTDFTAWIDAFNTGASGCDQNVDGSCTATDFTAWINNFNAGC